MVPWLNNIFRTPFGGTATRANVGPISHPSDALVHVFAPLGCRAPAKHANSRKGKFCPRSCQRPRSASTLNDRTHRAKRWACSREAFTRRNQYLGQTALITAEIKVGNLPYGRVSSNICLISFILDLPPESRSLFVFVTTHFWAGDLSKMRKDLESVWYGGPVAVASHGQSPY